MDIRVGLRDASGAMIDPPGEADSESAVASGPCVFVVDDEPAVLRVLARALTDLGYRPITFPSGAEAVAHVHSSAEAPQLAIVDMMMPDMDGTETVRALREILPDLPVIACTAYARAAGVVLKLPRTRLLEKPFDLDTLAACLAAVGV